MTHRTVRTAGVVYIALVALLAGCAGSAQEPAPPPSTVSDTRVQDTTETMTGTPETTSQTQAMSWRAACLLDPAALNPILAQATSETDVQIGESHETDLWDGEVSACEYTPQGVEWAYPRVMIRKYSSMDYGYLVSLQGDNSDLSWTAPNHATAYENACASATASAARSGNFAQCLPDVARGAVLGEGVAVVFLDDTYFAIILFFGLHSSDGIMPELLPTMADQAATAWRS